MIPAVSEAKKKPGRPKGSRTKKPRRTVEEVDVDRDPIDVTIKTVRNEVFAQEYLLTLDPKEAAVAAGHDPAAAKPGAHIRSNPIVKARILELMDDRAIRTGITADKVLRELALIGFANIKDFMTWNGSSYTIKPDTEIPDEIACAIKRFWYDKGGNLCVELYDKLQALDKIARHLGMFTQRLEIEAKITGRVDVSNGLNRLTNDELLELRALAEKMALPERSEVIDGEPVKTEET